MEDASLPNGNVMGKTTAGIIQMSGTAMPIVLPLVKVSTKTLDNFSKNIPLLKIATDAWLAIRSVK